MQVLATTTSDAVEAGAPTIADSGIEARLGFLRKTYGLFTAGLIMSSIGALAGMTVLADLAFRLRTSGLLVLLGIYFVAYFGVLAVRKVPVVNVLALFAYTFLSGLLLAPLLTGTLALKGITVGLANILTAFFGTTFAFGGLTAYVFITRKDFSYMGGFLALAFAGLFAFALCAYCLPMLGIAFTVSAPMWIGFSAVGLLLGCGFVLFETSQILHHYATDEYVHAALVLYIDFIMIFRNLLYLLNSRD